ncbi:hypothetical protein, partial [Candidatus Cardinium hertigii]|uniref:hypothetical protein n=2 Tax=Candidatus Cardinium TaxID=273135 RepID=UPI001FA972E9
CGTNKHKPKSRNFRSSFKNKVNNSNQDGEEVKNIADVDPNDPNDADEPNDQASNMQGPASLTDGNHVGNFANPVLVTTSITGSHVNSSAEAKPILTSSINGNINYSFSKKNLDNQEQQITTDNNADKIAKLNFNYQRDKLKIHKEREYLETKIDGLKEEKFFLMELVQKEEKKWALFKDEKLISDLRKKLDDCNTEIHKYESETNTVDSKAKSLEENYRKALQDLE